MRSALGWLPNALSGSRLVLLVPLWLLALRGDVTAVGWLLVLAGITDVLDGWLARRLGVTSAFGAQLDSLADNLLAPSGAAWLVMLRGDLVDVLWTPLFTWLCFYAAFMAIGWIRFRRFGNLHLWSAKAAAVVQYAFVVHAFLFPGIPRTLFGAAFALSMLSLLEGLAVQLICRRVDEHAGSLFLVLGRRARVQQLRPSPVPCPSRRDAEGRVSAAASPAAAGVTPAHVVFGRGGIRGIAMVGAAIGLSRAGYRIERASGVSVGGIVAALLASGHTTDELRQVVWALDYAALGTRPGRRGPFSVIGALWSLLTRLGCYDGDALERALREILARKGVRTFADLRVPEADGPGGRYRLQVLCSDVTRGRLVILPEDAVHYGVDPDGLEVARALRMSASLPVVYAPVRFGSRDGGSLVVDGGLVAGIPYRLFHASRSERWVTIGVQAGPAPGRRPPITGPVSFLRAAYYTALRANQECQDAARAAATIDIDCGPVGAIDFHISDPGKQALFDAGVAAVERFVRQPRADRSRDPALARNRVGNQLSIAGG